MKQLILIIALSIQSLFVVAQSSNDIASMTARICQTDSVWSTLGVYNEDSVLVFHIQTPDYESFGAPSYAYEKFDLVFDVSSNLLFNQTPFGKIDLVDVSKKKSTVVIELSGLGDRKNDGLWTYAVYRFRRSKGGPWLLDGVDYRFDDYFKGKKLDE
ncbi:hypothetical protein [Parvicella tangerina]|uniref:Nuclear transport factor 2 family protein n=1 Tax=Parvicella tangerina TaxID=2829795 RepID=A0A916NQ12_9FLAO|nr:hypothetical protein [Parvicella tangerina]CAG5078041.1 hypothetical protein CRYO30217_00553 [Parvicella tangerina]